jgi:D-alanyl-D-alanine carboxypeptidase (penicillin-binding protein 5/6)
MRIKKYLIILIIFIHIISITFYVYADDDNEEADIEDYAWVYKEIQDASAENSDEPNINSRAGIIYDRKSGEIIWGKEENTRRKMASTTKIMTSIVVIENCKNLDQKIKISSKSAGIGGSTLGLSTGDEITINDLLYGLMLKSGNDCAIALAENIAGSVDNFVDKMNQKVEELGLTNTHFVTVNGLDAEEHYTTAYELAKIADYALKNDIFKKIVGTKNYTVTINGYGKNINNTNELLGNLNGVYGVKTGFTNGANRCLVTAVKRDNMDLICIVLGADTKKDRTRDSIKMIEYAFKNYKMVNVENLINDEFEKWKNENKIKIIKGIQEYADVRLSENEIMQIPILNTNVDKITVGIENLKVLDSPVEKNKKIGILKLKVDDEVKINIDIVVANNVRKKGVKDYFKETLKSIKNIYIKI